jgi:hypothetical protein
MAVKERPGMGTKIAGAAIIAFSVAALLAAPGGLAAKGRRGALIILTKADGAEVKGELVSVKPDSLLLLRSGDALTIPRDKVLSVTLMRRSRKASGALTGLTIGTLAGVAWGGSARVSGATSAMGTICGGLGLVIGMVSSRAGKAESIIQFTGLTGPAADERWNALGAYSREGRLKATAKRPGP